MSKSFFWHDYETWGSDPSRDRPAQFAGLRTDLALRPVGEPLVIYCRPADDLLPHPEACLITGITPQRALEQGVREAEFITRIHQAMATPGTCGVGYNSIRFDDEITRYTLYRNFFEPYGREWRNGNSRWDLIDVVRMAHALRPEGIQWPMRDDGHASFRLEDLSAANGIGHDAAHDALSDVRATIGLASLLRAKQPKLFDYALSLRFKRRVAPMLDLKDPRPLLHVSSKYPAELGCIAPVLPLAQHPVNSNGIVVVDLRVDPEPLFSLDAETIRERVFTRTDELPGAGDRIPLKTVHRNRSPMLAPMATLSAAGAERWRIDVQKVQRHAAALTAAAGLADKIRAVFQAPDGDVQRDPERDLYGGFLSDEDKALLDAVRITPPEELGRSEFPFRDPRLPILLFRYRARNWPDTLAPAEKALWDLHRKRRFSDPDAGLTLADFRARIDSLRTERAGDPDALRVLDSLQDWGRRVAGGAE